MKSVPPVTVAPTHFVKAFHPKFSQLAIVLLKCNSYPLNPFFEQWSRNWGARGATGPPNNPSGGPGPPIIRLYIIVYYTISKD